MREIGIEIPPEMLIKSSTLQEKNELIEAMQQQQQQQQQMAQQQQQVQMQVLQAQIEDLKSRAMANQGLGVERLSRIEENRALAVERVAEAQKDRDLGTLDRIKAVKELTDIDLNQIERAVHIIRLIQESQVRESVQSEEEVQQERPLQAGAA
jgi:hypothetical protein